jgi:uncharacterized protein YacL
MGNNPFPCFNVIDMATKNTVQPEKLKLLPAPRQQARPTYVESLLWYRIVVSVLMFILGFNFSNTPFFKMYPLFGLRYLAELLISLLAAALGFFVLPYLIHGLRTWSERLIMNTVVEIVSNFWELQSKKIQEQRRQKQKSKSDSEKEKLEEALKNAIVLDTSVLIDGRILELVKLNFMDNPLIVPQEVINELHMLSDSKDVLKRKKGRRGLDVVRDLKRKTAVLIKPIQNGSGVTEVDKLLVNFAKSSQLKLATQDFNLSKVAGIAGIKVLNVNALASSVKTVLLPGEEIEVKVQHAGKEKEQGVSYLEDGTMIIIEGAKDKVEQEIKIKVTKVIQSPAGKIVFAK